MKDIRDIINKIEEEKIKTPSTEEWERILGTELSMIYSTRPYLINPEYVYRARSNWDNKNNKSIDFFTNCSDLWAPPANEVKKLGRCNNINESILYCSVHNPLVTIFELSPQTDSEITIMEYKTNGNIGPLIVLGVEEISTIGPGFKKIFENHFVGFSNDVKGIDNYLSGIFKRRSQIPPEELYNFTNALKRIFLCDQKSSLVPDYLKSPKNIGIGYPSVETILTGMNLALEPNYMKNILMPNIVYKYKIIKRYDKHVYSIQLTHKTSKIENEKLFWESTEGHIENITDIPQKQ